ncbi:hypothetical protein IFM89_029269 [Coptis chinensis]|uniref:Myb/SANT-like domain-containing protein n=1 Tax=Coptis chinensis TaxID=261450 RepID=A0A835HYN2_9MAGN|nr:hypothetical protein IFM89_029269 [Coptis chinensis]
MQGSTVVGAMAAVTSAVTTVFALADSIPRKPYVNRDIDKKLYLDGVINDDRMEETQQSVKGKSKQEKKNYRRLKLFPMPLTTLALTENVVGHMKTTKAKYTMIKSLKERSGWAWDDELKMIKVDKEDPEDFIEENPYAKGLLNVSIEQYDELSLTCGMTKIQGVLERQLQIYNLKLLILKM